MTDVVDSLGMWKATWSLPEQMETAAERARGLEGLPERSAIEHVVVLGMGGSGIAGDILEAAAGPFMAVPVVVSKNYTVPAFVGESSLVFAVSFSGNTEETLEAADICEQQGAEIVVVSRGGKLADRADALGAPHIQLPDDIPMPRAGIGALSAPLMVALEEIGLFQGASEWIRLAVDQLKVRRDELLGSDTMAAEIARTIGRTIPIVYGGGGLGTVAAKRWKGQFNENVKIPAFFNSQPEACHNEVCGWGQHGDLTRQIFTVVNLRHEHEHPQISQRFDLVNGLVDEVVHSIVEVEAAGEGQLAQLMDLVLIGDLVSLHMAANEGLDPGPVPVLEDLKRSLAGT